MNFIKKIFKSKETKALLGVLDELGCKFDNQAFQLVNSAMKKSIALYPESYTEPIKSGKSAREVVLMCVSNISGDLLESGRFHLYRGVLNDLSGGTDLLILFDYSTDELHHMGASTEEFAKQQKSAIREIIKKTG